MAFVSEVIKVFIFKQVCLNHLLACFDVYSRNYFPLFSKEFSFPIKNLFKHNMSMFSPRNFMSFQFFLLNINLSLDLNHKYLNTDSKFTEYNDSIESYAVIVSSYKLALEILKII